MLSCATNSPVDLFSAFESSAHTDITIIKSLRVLYNKQDESSKAFYIQEHDIARFPERII